MSRRFKTCVTVLLFALSFVTLGKAPRFPEPRGLDALEAALRQSAPRGDDPTRL